MTDDSRILDALSEYDTPAEAVASGRFLFHATCEKIDGRLRGGDFDGILWTAPDPAIAQLYIPESPGKLLLSKPGGHRLEELVSPGPNGDSAWIPLAEMFGYGPFDRSEIEYRYPETRREVVSWSNPSNWPTYRQVCDLLETKLGYTASEHGTYWLKQNSRAAQFIVPADYVTPGTLYITLKEAYPATLSLKGSGDGSDFNNLEGFRKAIADSYDLVVISDRAQRPNDSNVSHVSYGLTPQAAARAVWAELSVVHRDLSYSDGARNTVTEDFEEFFLGLKADAAFRP